MQNASVLSLEILREKIVSGHTSITENPWILTQAVGGISVKSVQLEEVCTKV
jgi:hypothetical protein